MRATCLLLAISALASAQQPRIVNAKLQPHPAGAAFASQVQSSTKAQAEPAWFGYAQPIVSREHNSCCFYSSDSGSWIGCSLEGRGTMTGQANTAAPVQLEGPSHVVVLFRIAQGAVEKIRTFSLDCDLDAEASRSTGIRVCPLKRA